MIRREFGRLTPAMSLHASPQGRQWWTQMNFNCCFLAFAPEGMTSWLEGEDLVLGWELPFVLPIRGSGLSPHGRDFNYVLHMLKEGVDIVYY